MRRERLAVAPDSANVVAMDSEARGRGGMREPRTLKRLPRSLDDIRGLRVARWIRESTAGQYDRYGPASQREQQDRFIERHGLVDTGPRVPGRPQRHDGLALGDDDRDARRGEGRGVRPAPRRVLRPLAAQPAADARAPRGRPPPRRRRARHVRPADPVVRPARLGRADLARRPAPRSTAAACRSGSPTATPRSSTTATTRAGTRASASGACAEPPHTLEIDPATHRHRRRPVRALRPGQRQRRRTSRRRPASPRAGSG